MNDPTQPEQHQNGPTLRPAHPRTEPAKAVKDRCGRCPPPDSHASTGLSTAFPMTFSGRTTLTSTD